MDLILKPTSACNFRCTFCSSTVLSENDSDVLDLSYVREFLVRFPNTRTIIVNGGDPLMMRPEYYWEIISILEELGLKDTTISLTTNLWAFYKKPEMWQDLFKHPQVGVATSFQYGNARLKGDYKPYTEEEFWKVSDLFLERIGYRPSFIAVITKENEDSAIQTVELAKKMGVVCKVNYAVASGPKKTTFKGITIGNAGSTYVLSDIYEMYIKIHEAGLTQWEHNTSQMAVRLRGENTTCPQARDCDSAIRTLQPGGKYYSCGAFGDDGLYPIDFKKEMTGELARPLQTHELMSLKTACFECPMFDICNGCRKTTHDLKTLGLVETHCKKMKTLASKIIEINGMSDVLKPTPYIKEYEE
jgi:radical SAM protein with 4Fe4S-binding SPASM domain